MECQDHLKEVSYCRCFQLKEKLTSVYKNEIQKYNDHPKRKELPFKKIPILDCHRGDVIHCSSVHPRLVFQALKTVFPEGNKSKKFFKIPLSRLSHLQICLFDMNRPEYKFGLKEDPESVFDLIDVAKYQEIKEVPKEAYEFYQEWKDRGEPGAPAWGKIPHIFVKGTIPTNDLEVIDWRDPL